MTDKQIIIDGVDITKCIHRATNKLCGDIDPYCRCYTGSCNDIPNCYYKQLKRKEQECEELKKQYNCYACDTCKGKEDYINLKRHCENAIKSLHNKQAELDQLKADRKEALEQLEFVRTLNTVKDAENRKLSKTLTEIKEIAENRKYYPCSYCIKKEILQKISEVEDESNI